MMSCHDFIKDKKPLYSKVKYQFLPNTVNSTLDKETTEAYAHSYYGVILFFHECSSQKIIHLVGVNHFSHLFQQKLCQLVQVLQVFDHLLSGHGHVAA